MSEILLFVLSALVTQVVNAMGRVRGRAEPRRILVVKLDHLGDVVLATPLLLLALVGCERRMLLRRGRRAA